jgi:hypothetical protein
MPLFIAVVLIIVLFILSIAVLVEVGLCIGIANLMIYFIPTLDLATTLVPAAILATTLIIILGSVIKLWVTESIKIGLPGYYEADEDDEEDDEPEPPTVSKPQSTKYRVK